MKALTGEDRDGHHNGPHDASQGAVQYAALGAYIFHRTGDHWSRLP
jgi:hypothetical protein